jgi:nucleotide-binding universal stress UspA family protein
MKTILVATDFSPAALNAAKYAADMALAINADMVLLHVFQIPVTYNEVLPVILNVDQLREDAEKNLDELKDQLNRQKNGKPGIQTNVEIGSFFDELKAACEKINPYMVVMGSQGTTASDRFLFGGHTVYAMKHLMWPLITVPNGVQFSSIKKIGLACDFDKVIDTTPVHEIKLLMNDFKASLHILNTGSQKEYNPDIVFQSGMLQEMIADLKPQYHFITHKDADEGIMDFAEKNNIDLLIVLPKRHGLLNKLIHKSHTKQLVLHSHVPVMALHE